MAASAWRFGIARKPDMDRFIQHFDAVEDGDLLLCEAHGVAYQSDMGAGRIDYGSEYFDKYASYEGSETERTLNRGRCAMLARHAADGATVLDIGAGCGTFVREAAAWGFESRGFDINPKTIEYLKGLRLFSDNPASFEAVTFWDSLEHIESPQDVLDQIQVNATVLVAIPIFEDLRKIRESKHYRPGEHLYYFTEQGFIGWMSLHGYELLEVSSHETDAGREAIGAFAFFKVG